MSEDIDAADEALIQFLYQAPIGLVQARPDGEITMMNPMSAQLLMPLSRDGNLSNIFDVLEQVLPDLRQEAAIRDKPGNVICSMRRVTLAPTGPHQRAPRTLEFSLLRLDQSRLLGSLSDATVAVQQEQQRLASQLRDLSRTDTLTSLPNRAFILDKIEQALSLTAGDPSFRFTVLFINADRFDQVNAAHGAAVGDELLRMMARRIAGAVRHDDAVGSASHPVLTTGRFGGDEFVVILQGLDTDDACEIAQRLVDRTLRSYRIAENQVFASVSIGVVQRHQGSPQAGSVLQDASTAMREAKRAGGARYCLFEPEMHERASRRSSIEQDLRQALDNDELFVVYQPIVDLDTGCCSGVETLVRWLHPTRGIVSPGEFIDIAEETGLVGPLGNFVLNEGCRQIVQWQRDLGERAPGILSVNLSRAQLGEAGLVEQVRAALETSGLAPGHLQLEVTESLAAQGDQIQARLHELKALGLVIALDDFGTGYSSLACLHLLPVDVVKIDRSFVTQAETSAHHQVLIEATVKVARSLGMQTVAEGIETVGQARVLADLRCDKGQGYLFARPMGAVEATEWLLELMPVGYRKAGVPARSKNAAPLLKPSPALLGESGPR
ncbi:MAG TPA: EAL domain-containing protein [Lautropia sp.]|nr:EAL domain-containing protein [Lautropia sp.]